MTEAKESALAQAREVAAQNLASAVRAIDVVLGEGFAKANPSVLAAFMQSCATSELASAISEAGWHISHIGKG